jgi:GDP-4-dehydro-6-deoxy-D-mannose reductase
LLEAVKKNDFPCRIIVFGSSSEYEPTTKKIKENFPLFPGSPYAVSKIAQSNLAILYNKSFGLDSLVIRPFFVYGPDKPSNHIFDFAQQILNADHLKNKTLKTGNLNVIRDYLYISDAVRAIDLIAKKGNAGEVYNLSSGRGLEVKTILQKLIFLSQKNILIETEKSLLRTIDEPIKIGDNSKLKKLGWSQEIDIDTGLKKVFDFFEISQK